MPKYSIIVPAHNAASRISKVLSSIKGQRFNDYDYELIVICDACEDRTANIARVCTPHVYETNFHRDGLARSTGLDVAKGEWVLFLDDDDWWMHDETLSLIDSTVESVDADIIQFGFIMRGIGYMAPQMDSGHIWPNVWSKVWRRSFIGDTRFTDEWSVSDLSFTRAVLAKKPRIAISPIPIYYYNYMRPGSITETDRRCK